jgi:FkbM family methyltransferase
VPPEVKSALLFGLYESTEIRMIRKYLGGFKTLIDLGASLGFASSHALSVLPDDARLIAVEANPELVSSLRRRLESYAGLRRIDVVNAAVSYDGPTARLAVASSSVGSRIGTTGVEVPAVTLTQLLSDFAVEDHYALICDIEGAELDILRNDAAALARCSAAVVEFHPSMAGDREWTPQEVLDAFVAAGFVERSSRGPVSFLSRPDL